MAGATGTQVECPKCGYTFPLTDAVLGPLRSEISTELEKEFEDKLTKEKATIEKTALKQAQEASTKQISELSSRLKDSEEELKSSRENEVKFREERRRWKEEKEKMEVEIQRRMDAFASNYDDKQKLQIKAKDEHIERLSKDIEELQRQVKQGSQQAQGEVLEITLEEMLKTCFPEDEILPVAKGVKGADLIQRVNGNIGTCCGTIIWESKNTRNWSPQWIEKLRENQHNAGAHIAIIASAALPDSIEHFGQIEGVWVTRWPLATQVARAMRMALIELHQSKIAGEAKDQKMEILYDYLTGPKFKQRIDTIVRAFMQMRQQLNQERAAMERIWSRREKQLELVERGTTGLYGDLEAIAGASMPQIEALSLTYQLEGEDANESPS
jgi:hypothetical protein